MILTLNDQSVSPQDNITEKNGLYHLKLNKLISNEDLSLLLNMKV